MRGRTGAPPGRRLALLGAATATLLLAAPSAHGASWSAPRTLTACPTATTPLVVFPSATPLAPAGPGAILWSGDPGDCASPSGVGIATVAGADDAARPPTALPQSLEPPTRLGGLAAAAGVGDGRLIVAAGAGAGAVASSPLAVLEGRAGSTFGAAVALRAQPAPVATATSYLGDVALATVSRVDGSIVLRIQRHGAAGLSPPARISARRAYPTALAVGLDYRGDAMVVWAQGSWIYRRVLPAAARLGSIERVAASPSAPQLQALISDDDRGIVAWTADTVRAGDTTTTVYVAVSRSGERFDARPRVLERVVDPPGIQLPAGSMRLVRLASEGVMIAWTGMQDGRFVVRAAPVSIANPRPATVVSDPAGDAVLADLATGPHGEALALWTSAPRAAGGFDRARERLLGARGVVDAPGIANFAAPEAIAGPAPIIGPRAAIDPATDAALAAWQVAEQGLRYAVRDPLRAAAPAASSGRVGSDASLIAGGGGLVWLALAAVAIRRLRRRRRGTGGVATTRSRS